jgi:ABC-2 type transport system permease protein
MNTWLKLTILELKLFIREPMSMVFTFALPVIFLLVMGGVFGEVSVEENEVMFRGVEPMDYYTPAYVALVLTSLGVLTLPVHLTGYRERGVLKRMHASGIHAGMVLVSQGVSSLVVASVGALILWGSAMLIYDISAPESLLLSIAAFVLGTVCFTALGVALGATLPNTRTAQGLGLILFFIMLILGGAGPPPELLTGALRTIGNFTPTHHVIVLLQDPWLGFGWNVMESLIVGGITIAAGFVALRFFHWE